MKTGKNLSELATELSRQLATKRDYIADVRALRVCVADDKTEWYRDANGEVMKNAIVLEGINGGMPLRPTAHEQMGSILSIPKVYYDRMREQAPDLLVSNINAWLERIEGKKLVRTLDGGVRAILSDRYRPLDNMDLAEAVLPKLQELGGTVLSGEVTEKRFYMKAVTPRISGEVKKDDVIQAGLVVSNSEIGEGSLKIEELTYRLVCLNGAIHTQVTRQTHAGRRSHYSDEALLENAQEFYLDETRQAVDRAFFLKIRDAVSATLTQERFNKHLLAMQGAAAIKPDADPVKVVEVVQQRFGLGDAERGSILKHLIEGADLSAFGIGNALTRASQDVDDYTKATEMETAGGRVFEMSSDQWKSLLA